MQTGDPTNIFNPPQIVGGEFEHYITIPHAAKAFGIPTWTLRRAIKAGDVPAYRIGGRFRCRLSEIATALNAKPVAGGACGQTR